MKFLKKTTIFLGLASFVLCGETFAKTRINEDDKRVVSVKRGYYSGGTLAQRTSRYYEDRGYRPGKSGTFTMTGTDILGGPSYLHQSIPGFDKNNLGKSYAVPHEKVTDMVKKLRLYKPSPSPKKATPKSRSKKITQRPRKSRPSSKKVTPKSRSKKISQRPSKSSPSLKKVTPKSRSKKVTLRPREPSPSPKNTSVRKTRTRTRPPVTAMQTARGPGPLSQRLSKYYQDRGYRPGKSGSSRMTGRDLYLSPDQCLYKRIRGFDESDLANSVKRSYEVPHELVTRLLNVFRSEEAKLKSKRR